MAAACVKLMRVAGQLQTLRCNCALGMEFAHSKPKLAGLPLQRMARFRSEEPTLLPATHELS